MKISTAVVNTALRTEYINKLFAVNIFTWSAICRFCDLGDGLQDPVVQTSCRRSTGKVALGVRLFQVPKPETWGL